MDMLALHRIDINKSNKHAYSYLFTALYRLNTFVDDVHKTIAAQLHRSTQDMTRDELFSVFASHVMHYCEPVSIPDFAQASGRLDTLGVPLACSEQASHHVTFVPCSPNLTGTIGKLYRVSHREIGAFHESYSEAPCESGFIDYLRFQHYPHASQIINAIMRGLITLRLDVDAMRIGIEQIHYNHEKLTDSTHPDHFAPPVWVEELSLLQPLLSEYLDAIQDGTFKRENRAAYLCQFADHFLRDTYQIAVP